MSEPRVVQIARGLVRPVTAYACLLLMVIAYALGRDLDPATTGIIGTVIGFYFGDRAHAKAAENADAVIKAVNGKDD